MRVTRRFWLTLTAIGSLIVGGGLLDAPLLVVGAVGLAGWLLAMQFAFVRGVSRLKDELTVSQSQLASRSTGPEYGLTPKRTTHLKHRSTLPAITCRFLSKHRFHSQRGWKRAPLRMSISVRRCSRHQ